MPDPNHFYPKLAPCIRQTHVFRRWHFAKKSQSLCYWRVFNCGSWYNLVTFRGPYQPRLKCKPKSPVWQIRFCIPLSLSSFLMADATQVEWLFSTLTCFAFSTHIDDNDRDFAALALEVKELIETWQDLSVSHKEARALTKRLEVRNIRCSL